MASSAKYEDLHDDLYSLKEKIKLKIQQNISEGTLNGLFNEGDNLVLLMKKEVDIAPPSARIEMQNRWSAVNGEWASFKRTAKSGGFNGPFGGPSGPVNPLQVNLVRGTAILERTGASIMRATQVAQESEAIGTEVIGELGVQREALVRTRERLTDTNQDLKKTSVILRSMNRRVLTNKCLLIVIVVIEIAILIGLVYWKFIQKK